MKKLIGFIGFMGVVMIAYWFIKQGSVATGGNTLISRQKLFGNPDKALVRMSLDGKKLSYVSGLNGVMNVFVADIDALQKAEPITQDTGRGIRNYFWLADNQHIAYLKDDGGDENWRLHVVNVATKEDKVLTPEKVNARIKHVSELIPDSILVGLNDRDPAYHDIYRLNILTGEKSLVYENKDEFRSFVFDDEYRLRYVSKTTRGGGTQYFKAISTDQPREYHWESFLEYGLEDAFTTGLLGLTNDGETLYMIDSRGQDLNVLKAVDVKTGKERTIAKGDKSEITGIMAKPMTGEVEAYSINYLRNEWRFLDPNLKRDFDVISKIAKGEISVISRSLDDKLWIVAEVRDDGPIAYYRYHRDQQQLTFLFHNKSYLNDYTLAKMEPVEIPSRDGLTLVSYLTRPIDANGPVPLVVVVHGGPSLRDYWGYNAEAQWLASRGYAVLQINYRGSTGFGKKFKSAGDMEWGGKAHTDLLDGVDWAIKQGISDPKRIAIYGASYGGYAALWGATQSSDVFKCAIDIVGPSNLETLLATVPSYWASYLEILYKQVGDPRTEEGIAALKAASPLTHVANIRIPVLIAQGEKDPRIKQSESEQIVAAMKEKGLAYLYLLFKDEGHGFARPENRFGFYGVAEHFLAEQLGGKLEPLSRSDLKATTIIPEHVETVKSRFLN